MVPEIEETEDDGFRKGAGGVGVVTVIECGGGGVMTVSRRRRISACLTIVNRFVVLEMWKKEICGYWGVGNG